MDSDNKGKIYCDDDGEYRKLCHVCNELVTGEYYNNQPKSQSQINNL